MYNNQDFKLKKNVFNNQADSWPMVFDDKNARNQWGWNPKYNLEKLVKKMFEELSKSKKNM